MSNPSSANVIAEDLPGHRRFSVKNATGQQRRRRGRGSDRGGELAESRRPATVAADAVPDGFPSPGPVGIQLVVDQGHCPVITGGDAVTLRRCR